MIIRVNTEVQLPRQLLRIYITALHKAADGLAVEFPYYFTRFLNAMYFKLKAQNSCDRSM